jgi:hypothetical protein
LAAWIESLSGVSVVTAGLSAFIAIVTAAVSCYRLRVQERMHADRLQAAQRIAEAGSMAVLGPATAVVAPPSSPPTVEELLRVVGATAPAEGSPPKKLSGPAMLTELPPPVPPA